MADSGTWCLSSIVLLLGHIVGTEKILELSENAKYAFRPPEDNGDGLGSWIGKQLGEPTAPILALMFRKHMYSPQGWVLGSSDDTDQCDIHSLETTKLV